MKVINLLTIWLFGGVVCTAQSKVHFAHVLQNQFKSDQPGVTALVARNGEVLFHGSEGMANLELGIELDPKHVFRIGSITKQFTAVAILKLAEAGKLSLSDDLRKYLPEFLPDGPEITIEHLLTHTSGIKNYTDLPGWTDAINGKKLTTEEVVHIFKDESLLFSPGASFYYSNLGYILLGDIIERVSGLSFGQYLKKTFFEPLKMIHTQYDVSERVVSHRIPGYSKHNGMFQNSAYQDMTLPGAAGGLISNVSDLHIWYKNLFSEKVVSHQVLSKARQPFILNDMKQSFYGYGWKLGMLKGRKSIKHDGIINGFITYSLYLPEDQILVVLLSNCDCTDDLEIPASKMAAIALGDPFEDHQVKLDPNDLSALQGVYVQDDGQEKIITFQDGQLMLHDRGGMKTPLTAVGKNKFLVEGKLSYISFNCGKDISSFSLQSLDDKSTWVRKSQEVTRLESVKIGEELMRRYVGKYEFNGAFTLEITKVGNKLYGLVGNDRKEIVPYDRNKFFTRETDIRLIFTEARGAIDGLTLIQAREMHSKKIL